MSGIIAQTAARLSARWHSAYVRRANARLEKLLRAGEPYASPELARLSGRCAAHGVKAVMAAKKGGFYKRGRIVWLPCASGGEAARPDAIEK